MAGGPTSTDASRNNDAWEKPDPPSGQNPVRVGFGGADTVLAMCAVRLLLEALAQS